MTYIANLYLVDSLPQSIDPACCFCCFLIIFIDILYLLQIK